MKIYVRIYVPYSRKIWRGIKFGALADRPTDRQIKNPPIFKYAYIRIRVYGIDNNGCGRSRTSARARAHCRSQLLFDVHARRCKILCMDELSLAGQPLHTRRKGLASCLYATCSCCTVQCSPIRFVHVILKYAMFNYNIPYDRDRGNNRALRSIPYTQQPIKI